jgi:hypothetical protein
LFRADAERKSALEIMVFAAPLMAVIFVITVGLFATWLDERAERRKAR